MTGINFYIFVSAIVFGFGLYTLLTAKGTIRTAIAVFMLFFSIFDKPSSFQQLLGF